eukprot:6456689-Amphidinium_carterae.1
MARLQKVFVQVKRGNVQVAHKAPEPQEVVYQEHTSAADERSGEATCSMRRHARYGTHHLRKVLGAEWLEAKLCCGRILSDQYALVGGAALGGRWWVVGCMPAHCGTRSGLPPACSANLDAEVVVQKWVVTGWETFAKFAFSSSFTPGQSDDKVFQEAVLNHCHSQSKFTWASFGGCSSRITLRQ